MARVGLVFGGRSVEHQVSVRSARTVAEALGDAGHAVVPLGIAPDGGWATRAVAERVLAGGAPAFAATGEPPSAGLESLLTSGAEVFFPIVHGTWGEDGTLQGLFEMLDVPYVGAGVTASAVAMDKALCKRLLAAEGLPVVDWETLHQREFARDPAGQLARTERLPLPLFVKPAVGGSSVGVSKVPHRTCVETAVREAFRFDDRLIVERGVAGRELECAVLGHRDLRASVVGEIVPGREFYDYADKYLTDTATLIAPAELPAAVSDRLRALAVAAFAAIGGSGLARVDFLLEGDQLFVNEINTLPGFTSISMYPRLWGLTGVELPELVDTLVRLAVERHAERRSLDQGIKDWIATLSA